MAKLIYQNASIVALNEVAVKMNSGEERRKLEIQLVENTKDGMLLVGGIEAWDDSIDKMALIQGQTYAEIHCIARSRYKDGKWWWSVQAYKAVKDGENSEGAQAF